MLLQSVITEHCYAGKFSIVPVTIAQILSFIFLQQFLFCFVLFEGTEEQGLNPTPGMWEAMFNL